MKACVDCIHYKLDTGSDLRRCFRKVIKITRYDYEFGKIWTQNKNLLCPSDERQYAKWYEFRKCGKSGRFWRADK